MKQLVFHRNNDRHYEVRIYSAGDEHNWLKYGDLYLNEVGIWGLWTGVSYSSKRLWVGRSSDDYVEYTDDLDETFDIMEQELSEILEN